MITLTCTHCRATLTMDDAFAGGACRCQHCGTIQTVPAQLKKGGTATLAGATTAKTLYRRRPRTGTAQAPGTGLDELADVVASSGLTSSGLSSGRLRASAPASNSNRTMMLLVLSGVIIVSLLGVVVYLATRGGSASGTSASGTGGTSVGGEPGRAGSVTPNFCGAPMSGHTVVYVLDRGDSTRDVFGDLKQATYKSIASLGVDHRFQVVFWANDEFSSDVYPTGGPTFATRQNLDIGKRLMDDIAPHGKTEIAPALTKAFASHPTDVVIATGKAWDLDEQFVNTVEQIRQESPSTRIHTFALGDPGSKTALKTIARRTGGEYKVLSAAELQGFGQ